MKKALRYGLMVLVLAMALVVTGCSPDVGEDLVGTWSADLTDGTLYLTVQGPPEHLPFVIGHLNAYAAMATYTDNNTATTYNWTILLNDGSAQALANKVNSKVKAAPVSDACILVSLFNFHAFGLEALGSETLPYLSCIGEYNAETGELILDVDIEGLETMEGVTFAPDTLPL